MRPAVELCGVEDEESGGEGGEGEGGDGVILEGGDEFEPLAPGPGEADTAGGSVGIIHGEVFSMEKWGDRTKYIKKSIASPILYSILENTKE